MKKPILIFFIIGLAVVWNVLNANKVTLKAPGFELHTETTVKDNNP
jgi:hypothetical protein